MLYSISVGFHPTPAFGTLPIQLEEYSSGDPKLGKTKHPVHLEGEMSSNFGFLDDKEHFVITLCGSGRAIRTSSDHCFVLNHHEVVVELVCAC